MNASCQDRLQTMMFATEVAARHHRGELQQCGPAAEDVRCADLAGKAPGIPGCRAVHTMHRQASKHGDVHVSTAAVPAGSAAA